MGIQCTCRLLQTMQRQERSPGGACSAVGAALLEVVRSSVDVRPRPAVSPHDPTRNVPGPQLLVHEVQTESSCCIQPRGRSRRGMFDRSSSTPSHHRSTPRGYIGYNRRRRHARTASESPRPGSRSRSCKSHTPCILRDSRLRTQPRCRRRWSSLGPVRISRTPRLRTLR